MEIWNYIYQSYIIHIIFSGLEQGFVFADFTKSYVTCALGIERVGFVMICFGVVDAFFSLTLGKKGTFLTDSKVFLKGAVFYNRDELLFYPIKGLGNSYDAV